MNLSIKLTHITNDVAEFISKQDLILLIDELSMHYYDFFKHSPRWTLTQEMKSAMIDILDIDEVNNCKN